MELKNKEEKRSFRPNQNIIYHLIKSQNSTPISAIKELIQNSHDAKANKIELDFYTDENEFAIVDNGNGFKDRAEIESFFEEFGKAHQEEEYIDNEKFGRFRMGRCQIMAFASTVWRSGYFSMTVDIKKNGLDYILTEHENFFKGCKITGEWYSYEWEREEGRYTQDYYIEKLKKECKYLTNCELIIDDTIVNKKIDVNDITYEDDYFIFLKDKINSKDKFSNSNIYNLGIFTCNISLIQSGTIITKKHLELDISRKYILHNNCKTYEHIINTLEGLYGNKKIKRKKKLNSNERIEYFLNFLNNTYSKKDINWNNISDIFLFTNYNHTKFYTLEDLRSNKFVLVSENIDTNTNSFSYDADKIEQSKLFQIVDISELETAIRSYNSKHESANRIQDESDKNTIFFKILNHLSLSDTTINNFKKNNIPFEAALKSISSDNNYTILKEENLNKEQLVSFKAIDTAHRNTVEYLQRHYSKNHPLINSIINRKIQPGYSNGKAYAWTDGHSYIYVDINLLGLYKKSIEKIAFILIHEYCHDNTNNTHDGDFYLKFHILTCDNPDFFTKLMYNLITAYRARLNYYNLKVPTHIEVKVSSNTSSKKISKLFDEKKAHEEYLLRNMRQHIENKIKFNIEINEDLIQYFNKSLESHVYVDYKNIGADYLDQVSYSSFSPFEAFYLQTKKDIEINRFIKKIEDEFVFQFDKSDLKTIKEALNIDLNNSLKEIKIEILKNEIYLIYQFNNEKTIELPEEFILNFSNNFFNEIYDSFKYYKKRVNILNQYIKSNNIDLILKEAINVPVNLDFEQQCEIIIKNLKN